MTVETEGRFRVTFYEINLTNQLDVLKFIFSKYLLYIYYYIRSYATIIYVLLYRQLFIRYPCGFNNYDINNEK